jgi:putative redox protein
MTMPPPLASARARLPHGAARQAEVSVGSATVTADHGGAGASPLGLLAASLAACTAIAARTQLERLGERGDVEVVVTLDAGPPPLLYRRVQLDHRLDARDARALAAALDRGEVTMMLRPAFTIRTAVEHAGQPLL